MGRVEANGVGGGKKLLQPLNPKLLHIFKRSLTYVKKIVIQLIWLCEFDILLLNDVLMMQAITAKFWIFIKTCWLEKRKITYISDKVEQQ